jgi:TRAP-type C4-dicarboxylate transport system permease small subunit
LDTYVRAIRRISQLCGVVAAALIALGVIVVCQMVFIRYVLNQNTIWQTDFVTWSLVAATFIGSPYVLLTRGHVNVDVLPQYLGGRARWGLALASILMSLGFCLVLAVLTSRFWYEAWTNRWVSDTMWRARLWIPYAAMPIGLSILCLQYVADLYCLVTGREPPFGIKPAANAKVPL